MPQTHAQFWIALALTAPYFILATAQADAPEVKHLNRNTVQVQGVRVSAVAYRDRISNHRVLSRDAVRITKIPHSRLHWDLYNPRWGSEEGNQGEISQESAKPYRPHQHQTTITCRLRQYDEQEEKVTFHNLTLVRTMGVGFLTVTQPQMTTTASGITITLPVQNQKTFMPVSKILYFSYFGQPNAIFARVVLSPGKNRNVLPASALYQRHKVSVSLRIDTAAPVFMNSNSSSNGFSQITFSLRDPKATHIDALTLIIHQRAELQSIPLTFRVPIASHEPEDQLAQSGM